MEIQGVDGAHVVLEGSTTFENQLVDVAAVMKSQAQHPQQMKSSFCTHHEVCMRDCWSRGSRSRWGGAITAAFLSLPASQEQARACLSSLLACASLFNDKCMIFAFLCHLMGIVCPTIHNNRNLQRGPGSAYMGTRHQHQALQLGTVPASHAGSSYMLPDGCRVWKLCMHADRSVPAQRVGGMDLETLWRNVWCRSPHWEGWLSCQGLSQTQS